MQPSPDSQNSNFFTAVFWILPVLTILFLTTSLHADSGKRASFTLDELNAMAVREADRIHMARESVNMAKAVQDQARSAIRPHIEAFGSHSYYPDPGHTDPDRLNTFGLRLGQSITLNGKEWTALQMSRKAMDQSGRDLQTITTAYLLEVGSRFYQMIRAEEDIRIEEAEIIRLTRHLDEVRARLRLSDATRPDLLRTQAALSGAKSRHSAAREVLADQRSILMALVNLPADFSLLPPPAVQASRPEESLADLIQEALDTRPEMQSLKLSWEMAEDKIIIEKGGLWPTLSWSARYQDTRPSPSEHSDTNSLSVGLELAVPLYTGGLIPARIREAEAEKRLASFQYNQTVRDITLEVRRAYHSLEKALGSLQALEDQLLFATENYQAVSRQFEVGLANIVDLMDANTLMLTAQSSLIATRLETHLARLSLDHATGRLNQWAPAPEPGFIRHTN
ncbi:TolC family protein [Desulfobotulus sp. H1]|uniref:TolC family protein n=1 Tax=Desulfobotulus pelophilus TaxID=2823377 RepID=A0ABT3NA37_9BACT|nr:TolC family protein [Desulfobotulus pelophilus]MCW7754319.1 TolC family protein [Desulfobotulus pelophilus]